MSLCCAGSQVSAGERWGIEVGLYSEGMEVLAMSLFFFLINPGGVGDACCCYIKLIKLCAYNLFMFLLASTKH